MILTLVFEDLYVAKPVRPYREMVLKEIRPRRNLLFGRHCHYIVYYL